MLFFIIQTADAHQEYILNVDFGFNPELKENAVKNSKIFLNTTQEPLSFDLDDGMVSVNFEMKGSERSKYVLIADKTYNIHGFFDSSLMHTSGEEKYDMDERFKIAQKKLYGLPESTISQLDYDFEEKTRSYYTLTWRRKISGILVLGDDFKAYVDAVNGNVIGWRLSMFDFSPDEASAVPEITLGDAVKIARNENNNDRPYEKFPPYLVFNDEGKLHWLFMLYSPIVKNYYVGVDATTGEIIRSGTELDGEIPESYKPVGFQKAESSNAMLIILGVAIFIIILSLAVFAVKKQGVKK